MRVRPPRTTALLASPIPLPQLCATRTRSAQSTRATPTDHGATFRSDVATPLWRLCFLTPCRDASHSSLTSHSPRLLTAGPARRLRTRPGSDRWTWSTPRARSGTRDPPADNSSPPCPAVHAGRRASSGAPRAAPARRWSSRPEYWAGPRPPALPICPRPCARVRAHAGLRGRARRLGGGRDVTAPGLAAVAELAAALAPLEEREREASGAGARPAPQHPRSGPLPAPRVPPSVARRPPPSARDPGADLKSPVRGRLEAAANQRSALFPRLLEAAAAPAAAAAGGRRGGGVGAARGEPRPGRAAPAAAAAAAPSRRPALRGLAPAAAAGQLLPDSRRRMRRSAGHWGRRPTAAGTNRWPGKGGRAVEARGLRGRPEGLWAGRRGQAGGGRTA